jgi:hypothetical protein
VDLRPDVNDPVVLRDHADREYHSRVEHVGDGELTVARPLDLRVDSDLGPEANLLVTWGSSRGIVLLPTRLVAEEAEGRLRFWLLQVTGDGWVEQQRRFVRVPVSGSVTLWPRGDRTVGAKVRAHLVDVSEAAVRCTVPAAAADEEFAEGVDVTASFRLGDGEFAIPARVESHRPSARPDELAELVVVFAEPVRDADALRKQIYAQQLRSIRARQ